VFDMICSGFTDSAPALRELTLKSCAPCVSMLNPSNLEKLARYCARLGGDQEASIR